MAKTDDLIDSLARGLQPVRPHALLRLLTKALLPGVLLSGAFILFVHGLRPDIASAMSLPAFWVKSFYPLALAINGICAVLIVARPGGLPKSAGWPRSASICYWQCWGSGSCMHRQLWTIQS